MLFHNVSTLAIVVLAIAQSTGAAPNPQLGGLLGGGLLGGGGGSTSSTGNTGSSAGWGDPSQGGSSGSSGATIACNTGSISCCDQVQVSNGTNSGDIANIISGMLGTGIPISLPTGLGVGLNCAAILGENSCKQQTVCCDGTSFNGLINLGCTPINIL
ncbi:hypothetical protein D9757_001573 [Collybiopsis confluens]|uniref:Hydrophobin n=1 Tax=Collybiopsis confluens TaxID=2823264 RepID=A0A8H5HZH8_9AGAR|nr:hypothetical protein D9757_001573 [Collybiopsis confluens]